MEVWKWHSIKPDDSKFFDFYRKIIKSYGNTAGEVKINWKHNNKIYKFVFDKTDDNIFGIEVYELISNK